MTKIGIPSDIAAEYKALLAAIPRGQSAISPANELEFRLGSVNDKTQNFEPGISSEIYHQLIGIYSSTPKIEVKREESVTEMYEGLDLRKISFLPVGVKADEYYVKTKLKHVDLNLFFFSVRLGHSTEKKVLSPSMEGRGGEGKKKYTRHRFRTTVRKNPSAGWVIDLTVIRKQAFVSTSRLLEEATSYELEIEFDPDRLPVDVPSLVSPLKEVLHDIYNIKYFMSAAGIREVVGFYNSLVGKKAETGEVTDDFAIHANSPVDLTREDIPRLGGYSVTNKIDGLRKQLLIYKDSVYLISISGLKKNNPRSLLRFQSTSVPPGNLPHQGSLLDGEYVASERSENPEEYHSFDLLFDGLTRATELKFHDRIEKMKSALSDIAPHFSDVFVFPPKQFFYSTNPFTDTLSVLGYMKAKYGTNHIFKNDGLIYTPVNEGYVSRENPIRKYKFYQRLSFDLRLKRKSPGEFYLETFQRVQPPPRDRGTGEAEKKIILFSGTAKNKLPSPLIFRTTDPQFKEGMIVEFGMSPGSRSTVEITPFKVRTDKTEPNKYLVVAEVWDLMNNPIRLGELLDLLKRSCGRTTVGCNHLNESELRAYVKLIDSLPSPTEVASPLTRLPPPIVRPEPPKRKCLEEMRRYHNKIKRDLIAKWCTSAVVLDLGYGRGGDQAKYEAARASRVIGVEPNRGNITEAFSRLKSLNSDYRKRIELLETKAENGDVISAFLGSTHQVDVVASFFSLTFFFESENKLNELISTIDRFLKPGGHFIGTTMDGKRTRELLSPFTPHKKYDLDECCSITKLYTLEDSVCKDYGNSLLIDFGEDIIVKNQKEGLVLFEELLIPALQKRGIRPIAGEYFEGLKSGSPTEVKLSRLNRWFVFQKDSVPSPPRLISIDETVPSFFPGTVETGSPIPFSILHSFFRSYEGDQLTTEGKRERVREFVRLVNKTITWDDCLQFFTSSILSIYSREIALNVVARILIRSGVTELAELYSDVTDSVASTDYEGMVKTVSIGIVKTLFSKLLQNVTNHYSLESVVSSIPTSVYNLVHTLRGIDSEVIPPKFKFEQAVDGCIASSLRKFTIEDFALSSPPSSGGEAERNNKLCFYLMNWFDVNVFVVNSSSRGVVNVTDLYHYDTVNRPSVVLSRGVSGEYRSVGIPFSSQEKVKYLFEGGDEEQVELITSLLKGLK